ncbi:MAG: transglutaminase domain-containing protein [Kiritimatiellia bacterium]
MVKVLQMDHETLYEYDRAVLCSSHLAHLGARDTARQRWLTHRLSIEPEPTSLQERVDMFGNKVLAFSVEREYRRLRVFCEGTAEVGRQHVPSVAPSWEETARRARTDLEAAKYLFNSPYAPGEATIANYARASFTPGRSVLEAAAEIMSRIHRDCRYVPGATKIGDPPAAVLRMRQGVCQDFAHLMIACMRAFGVPCRYISGYLRTYPPPGEQKLVGCDATHAWCAVWAGGEEWIEFDPTNDILAGFDHIVLAWGRDFGDVSPLKGVITGGGNSILRVAVNVNELEKESEP